MYTILHYMYTYNSTCTHITLHVHYILHYLYCLPVPVPVLVFLGQSPHVEVGLHHLRTQDVVLLILTDRFGFCVAIKPKCLRS